MVGELAKAKKLEEANGRGRGKGSVSDQQLGEKRTIGASTSSVGQKKSKTIGFGIYTDQMSGSKTLNVSVNYNFNSCNFNYLLTNLILLHFIQLGTRGETVVTPGVYKDATQSNIDIGYKPRGMKQKGKNVVTTS